ncbi:MAG TPA: AsmA-like C-terminal region-containing protein, partial [Blastocatellia bacterium]|nr:AsmA-like C-terminal region-containing protein [Blastocatellia bacterium]
MSARFYIRSEDFNRYVAGEIKAALREFGARVEIGSFGISWDTQTARLRDLKIYNDRTGQLVATIKRADTLIEIPDLYALQMSRRVVIKKIEVEGADFFYEVDRRGGTNLDGLHYVRSESKAIIIDTTRLLATLSGGAIHVKDHSRRIDAEIQGAQATAESQPQNPNAFSLRFNSSAGRVNYEGRENRLGKFDLTARASEGRVEVENLSLESNVAQVKAKGHLDVRAEDLAELRYGFDFDSRVKLDEASRALAMNTIINGQAAVNGRIDGEGANYTIKGGASCNEASVANVKLSDARVPFSGKGKGNQVNIASDQIRAQTATVDTAQFGSIVINDLSLNNLAAKISGANYEIKALAAFTKGEIRGALITGVSAQATLDSKAIRVSDIKAALFNGTVSGEYVLPLTPGAAQTVKASFADLETKSATALFDIKDLPVSGKARGEVELSLAGADLRSLNGRITSHFDGKSSEESEAMPITGDVEIKTVNGVFNFDQLKLATGASTLISGGSLSVDGDSDLRVSLNSTSAEQLIQLARGSEAARRYIQQYEPQLIGAFKFEGRVMGPVEKAVVDGDVNAETFGLRDAVLGSLAGHISVSPSEARVEKGLITASNGGSLKFDLATPLDTEANTGRLDATLDRMNLEAILAASGSPSMNQFITGDVSGEIHLTGLPASASGTAAVNLVNGKIAEREAQLATAGVKFDGRNALLERLEVSTPQQHLTASGSMNLEDYSFRLVGKADRISLDNLAEALEMKETRVEGVADADFQIGGKVITGKQVDLDWESLKVELTAQGRGVKVNGRDTGELKLTANTSSGGRINAQLVTGILAANGKAHAERKPDLIKASLELRAPGRPVTIESNLAKLDIAPFVDAFAPELNSLVKGTITGSLRMEGPSVDDKGAPAFDRLRGYLTLMDVAIFVADNPVKVE